MVFFYYYFFLETNTVNLVKDTEDLSEQDIYIWLKYWETSLQFLSQIVLSPLQHLNGSRVKELPQMKPT